MERPVFDPNKIDCIKDAREWSEWHWFCLSKEEHPPEQKAAFDADYAAWSTAFDAAEKAHAEDANGQALRDALQSCLVIERRWKRAAE